MKKKLFAVVMAAALAMSSLAACGSAEEAAPAAEAPVAEAPAASEDASPVEASADAAVAELADAEVQFFAAASLEAVMTEVIAKYNELHPNVTIVTNYDSSGTLLTQIQEGYACDVFFSAAQKQMNALEEDSMLVEGTRTNVVNNQVIVVVSSEASTEAKGLETLGDAESLALADGSVPVGKYTRKALVAAGILAETDKPEEYTSEDVSAAFGGVEINECGNVSKVRTAVIENPGQVGTIYYSDYYQHESELTILETVSYDLTGNIIYPLAQVVNEEANEAETAAAADFIAFIKSDAAKEIFATYCFDTNVE